MNYQTYKQRLYQQLELLLDYAPYATQSQTQCILAEIQYIRLKITQIAAFPDIKKEVSLFTATVESKLNDPNFKL